MRTWIPGKKPSKPTPSPPIPISIAGDGNPGTQVFSISAMDALRWRICWTVAAERPVQYSFSAACASLQRLAVVIAPPSEVVLQQEIRKFLQRFFAKYKILRCALHFLQSSAADQRTGKTFGERGQTPDGRTSSVEEA